MNLKEALRTLGFTDMKALEREARKLQRAMSPEQKRQLRKQFTQKAQDQTFRDLVEDTYEEIKENVEHDSDSEK